MSTCTPHYLLFSDARPGESTSDRSLGRWHFVLESLNGDDSLEAAAEEPVASAEMLELLAVLRGLEALDQRSRVTLITTSRYVARGLRHGLENWREDNFQWERFGRQVPIKHGELWRRIDHALSFHQLDCRLWNVDSAASVSPPVRTRPASASAAPNSQVAAPAAACRRAARLAFCFLRRWLSPQGGRPAAAAA